MRAYLRPLGEPNRCLNVYASYDCDGNLRDAAHKPRWYRLAFAGMGTGWPGWAALGHTSARKIYLRLAVEEWAAAEASLACRCAPHRG